MIRKVIIPAAGSGERLFPATKEQPKEMLPIFAETAGGEVAVKPVVQVVFEQLYDAGFREFCYIVGRGKRSIEDHFTPDHKYFQSTQDINRTDIATDLREFYDRLAKSTIIWVNQPEAKGFGNAVLMARPFVQEEQCLVHAGDSTIVSEKMDYIKKLVSAHNRLEADATFIVLEIEKPYEYGVVEGKEIESGIIKVKDLEEKPIRPRSKFAIIAVYAFRPVIFKALEKTKPGKNEEIQLTDAIKKLIENGSNVYAIKLDKSYSHLDVGNPKRYWEALDLSHNYFCRNMSK